MRRGPCWDLGTSSVYLRRPEGLLLDSGSYHVCRGCCPLSCGPLVRSLELLLEATHQGADYPLARHTKDDSRSLEPSFEQPVFLRGSLGSTRYSVGSCVLSAVAVAPLLILPAKSGGDEETRTPDPLLAKEMLFQLSYVPLPLLIVDLMVGVSGLEPETSALSGQCSNQLS